MLKLNRSLVGGILAALFVTSCATQQDTGTLVGAGAGALLGSQFGSGSSQVLATAVGAAAGAFIGNQVGASMDKTDQLEAQQVLESNRVNQTTTWVNPDTQTQYAVTPTKTYTGTQGKTKGQVCRDFTTQAMMAGGEKQTIYGRACRQSDGTWQAVN